MFQLIRGGRSAVKFYSNPNALVERLRLMGASKTAGSNGLDNEISAIRDELLRYTAIFKELALELNRSMLLV